MSTSKRPAALERSADVEPVFIRIATAAKLTDSTTAGLRKRLTRAILPAGILTRAGRTLLLHRARFLEWVAAGCPEARQ